MRKSVPLSQLAQSLFPHIADTLYHRDAQSESSVLAKALTRGLLSMMPEVWPIDGNGEALPELQRLTRELLSFFSQRPEMIQELLQPYINLQQQSAPTASSPTDLIEESVNQQPLVGIEDTLNKLGNVGFSFVDDDDD